MTTPPEKTPDEETGQEPAAPEEIHLEAEPETPVKAEEKTKSKAKPSLFGKLAIAAADIKIAHSVFALPFAILAAFLAGPGRTGPGEPTKWVSFSVKLVLIVLCMVFARTWAMLINRMADRRHDAKNPRTAERAFADERLSTLDGLVMLAGSGGLFVATCAMFTLLYDNQWPLYGSLPVLAWIAFYSFTKRFTLLCHVFLGGALAISPIAAAVAVDPSSLKIISVWLISAMVLCWVAGFDIIYALQDVEYDKGAGLHSVPSRLGPKRAINLSRVLHLLCMAALLLAWWLNPNLGSVFGIGVASTAVLLVAEHLVLVKRGKAGLGKAFFTLNGVLSLVLGITGIIDVLS